MDLKLPTFDGIKDRLGFSDQAERSSRPGRHAGTDRTEQSDYDDYGEYGYDDGYDGPYGQGGDDASYGDAPLEEDDYGDYGEYGYDDGYASASQSSHRTHSVGAMPPLITADDVRAHTQYSPSMDAEPHPTRAQRLAAQSMASGSEISRSEGLNSLFSSTTPAARPSSTAVRPQSSSVSSGSYSHSSSVPAPVSSSVKPPVRSPLDDPKVIQRPTRILTVLKPEKYDEAERVAKILKAGDVAVLALKNTQPELSKRILDFSFGAASALDARVEFMGDQVFVISRGTALSEDERTRLRNQGVI